MTDGQTVVGGRYQLQELVGRGGMAEVHRALDLRLGRPVAVKILSGALAADPTAHTRFRREAQAVASLNDPSIASVYDTGEDVDPSTGAAVPYIVMELVEGSTLRALLADGPLPPAEALRITRTVLDALASSHDAGIVHRDIKPANVMVTPAGAVKVMDFGIARAVDDTSSHLTQTSAVIGTAHYLSPEQARGEEVDLRSDLYSVGCLLFELLTGRPPFVGETSISVAYQHVREAPVAPSQLDPSLPRDLDAVVLHALAKDPDDRYPSAREMRADVELLLSRPDGSAIPTRLAATVPVLAAASPPLPSEATVSSATPVEAAPVPVVAAAPPADPPEHRRSGLGRVLLVTTALLLVLSLGVFGLVRLLGQPETATASVAVPNVFGATRAEAEKQLRDAGLVPAFRNVRGKAGKTVDTATGQKPAAGETIRAGSTVTVEVNVGPASARVPDGLVGEDRDRVEQELEDAGFTDVRLEAVSSPADGVAPGEVVSVKPDEGERAALDETVLVRYAGGGDASDRSGSGSGSGAGSGGSGSGGGGGDDDQQDSTRSPQPSATSEPSRTEQPTRSPSPAPEPSDSVRSSEPAEPSESPEPAPQPTPTATKKAKKEKAGEELTGNGAGGADQTSQRSAEGAGEQPASVPR